MIKKLSINRNKNIYGKKSNKKGGRPGAAAANAPDEEAEKKRLKELELTILKEQAEIAARKPLPTNTDGTDAIIECINCGENIEYLNSPIYLRDVQETLKVKEPDPSNPRRFIKKFYVVNHRSGEAKVPHFIMRCPLGDHFYCSECFQKQVQAQIKIGRRRSQSFMKNEPFYITCCGDPNCEGLYSNGQIKRLVSEETYARLEQVIRQIKMVKKDDICNLDAPENGKIFTCPRCLLGPQPKENCYDMMGHHGEENGPNNRKSNACWRCGFITPTDYDFIEFKRGDKSCNMCNDRIEDTKEEGIVGDTYYTKRAIADFDRYFNWPDYIQPILEMGRPNFDQPRKKYIMDLFINRDTYFNSDIDELIKTLSREKKNIQDPDLIYKEMVNVAIRCSRARNSLIIFLIDKCEDGQSELFTRDKVMKYLSDKEPNASYLAPSIIAIRSAELILNNIGYKPFHKIPANSSERSLSTSVDVGIFALAHYLADPGNAVANYLNSSNEPPNDVEFAKYDDKGKQDIIREIVKGAIDEIRKKKIPIKTDEEIQALETAVKQEEEAQEEFALTNKIITIDKEKTIDLCRRNISHAEAKELSQRVKSLTKVLEAIDASTPEDKVRLGRDAYNNALTAYKMHQQKVFNEFYIKALDITVTVKTFPKIIWYKERLKDTKRKGEPDINKVLGDLPFTLTPPASDSIGAFTYLSSKKDVATVDRQTGEVTIKGIGTTTITAMQAAHGEYESYFNEAELKVADS
jgi:hypothetical protein